jgi:CO dehydrogenase/acetyl-CoA synthase beta subunit
VAAAIDPKCRLQVQDSQEQEEEEEEEEEEEAASCRMDEADEAQNIAISASFLISCCTHRRIAQSYCSCEDSSLSAD